MAGLTLDAGALIAYERADGRVRAILATAQVMSEISATDASMRFADLLEPVEWDA